MSVWDHTKSKPSNPSLPAFWGTPCFSWSRRDESNASASPAKLLLATTKSKLHWTKHGEDTKIPCFDWTCACLRYSIFMLKYPSFRDGQWMIEEKWFCQGSVSRLSKSWNAVDLLPCKLPARISSEMLAASSPNDHIKPPKQYMQAGKTSLGEQSRNPLQLQTWSVAQ